MSGHSEWAVLEARVRRLERANRAILVGVCAVGCLVLAGAAPGPPTPGVVRTRALEVVDEAGRVRVVLEAAIAGPELRFLDADGVVRVSLGHDGEGSGLSIQDSTGTTRIGLVQFAHGGGGLALHGEGAKGAAVLSLEGGKGTLTFYGPDGSVLHRVPATRGE